ncbi:MAG: C4-dicarboxylate TRAP transporter substrate-binding protein [Deltaproteobacteria bacterium]|nr:C4-dicarboxylate TRAP transporter substrate-binding protein [Deltaproteobacteria bacterium]
MRGKRVLTVAIMFLFFITLPATITFAKVYNWKFASYVPAANKSLGAGQKRWAEEIERRSNGQIKVKIYWARELVGPKEMPNAVKSGLVDVVGLCPAYTPGQTPFWSVIYMPFLPPARPDQCLLLYDRLVKESKALKGEMDKFNCVYVGGHDSTPYNLMGKKPVRNVEDLKGLRIRCMSDHGKVLGKFGSVTVSMPVTQMYTSLDKGLIDEVAFAFEGFRTWKIDEISKYTTLGLNMGALPALFWLNKDRWNELPDNLKKVVQSVAEDHIAFVTNLVYGLKDATLKSVKEKGIEISQFPKGDREKLLAVAPGVWDGWAKRTKNYDTAKAVLADYIRIRDEIVAKYPQGIVKGN